MRAKPAPFLRRSAAPLALLFLALAVYANTFPGSFILDDVDIVQKNPLVENLDIGKTFSTDYWGAGANSGMYRPLTILSYTVNRRLFGPDPFSFHLINLLLHAAVTLLLYRTLAGLGLGTGVAWLAAALFAVHPIHGEVVNEVIGRAELLVAFFTFLGLRAALRRTPRHVPLVLFWYGAALLSKESAAVFLPLLICFDLFSNGSVRGVVRERKRLYLSLAGVTFLWLILRTWALAQATVPPYLISPADNPLLDLPLLSRFLSAFRIQLLYLRHLIVPFPLMGVYSGHFVGRIESVFSLPAAGVAAALAFIVFATVRGWKRRRGYGLGLAFYFASFLVNFNIIFLTYVAMADRFAYLPSAGFCLAAASLFLIFPHGTKHRALRLAGWSAGLCYLAFLSFSTVSRNPSFADALTLWKATVENDPRSGRGWLYLAGEYELMGMDREAEDAYRRSIEGEPQFTDSRIHFSNFLLTSGRPREALEQAAEVERIEPGGIGSFHLTAAKALLELGRPGEALVWLDKAHRIYQSRVTYREIRGKVLDALGDAEGAIESFHLIHHLDTVNPLVPQRLAELLLYTKKPRRAEEVIRTRIDGDKDGDFHNLLGVSLVSQGRFDEAEAAFGRAIELDPEEMIFRENLKNARDDGAEAKAKKGSAPARTGSGDTSGRATK